MSNAELAVRQTPEDVSKLQNLPCCEKPAVDITWNKRMHEEIVLKAIEGLNELRNDARVGGTVSAFLDAWPARKASALKALEDADWHAPYTDYIYSSHFYDPDSGGSWFGQKNALSQALQYYFEAAWRIFSTKSAQPASASDIGYSIGLALHYVTDLTQPMHAANFIEIPLLDGRHSGFESAANSWELESWSYSLSADDVDPAQWRSPAQIVSTVARRAKDAFTRTMKPILDRKLRGEEIPFTDFSDFEVRTIMDRVSEYAIKLVAAFLVQLQAVGTDVYIARIFQRLGIAGPDIGYLGAIGLALSQGKKTREIVRTLVSSAPFLSIISSIAGSDRRNAAEATRELYRRVLARECSDDEVKSWAGWMSAGRIVESAQYMVDSQEYSSRFGDYEIPFA